VLRLPCWSRASSGGRAWHMPGSPLGHGTGERGSGHVSGLRHPWNLGWLVDAASGLTVPLDGTGNPQHPKEARPSEREATSANRIAPYRPTRQLQRATNGSAGGNGLTPPAEHGVASKTARPRTPLHREPGLVTTGTRTRRNADAQAMNSSSETWAGTPKRRATLAADCSIGVGRRRTSPPRERRGVERRQPRGREVGDVAIEAAGKPPASRGGSAPPSRRAAACRRSPRPACPAR